ncbi:MAG: hypothetical protein HZB19_10895 [Chloroflexi bacterium]|nr:hypothetical protein [Chloroflexota bacterium]
MIIHDENGSPADLKRAAVKFEWSLQPLADKFASAEISSCAEEVYKILSGLSLEQESKVLYACMGLVSGMAEILAVQRGILIETENRYFDLIQESAGLTSEWTRLFRLALGAESDPSTAQTYKVRGRAALGLYRQTAEMMKTIILNGHREVIISALNLIETAGY